MSGCVRLAVVLGVSVLLSGGSAGAEERVFVGITEPVVDLRLGLPVDGLIDTVAVTEGDRGSGRAAHPFSVWTTGWKAWRWTGAG